MKYTREGKLRDLIEALLIAIDKQFITKGEALRLFNNAVISYFK